MSNAAQVHTPVGVSLVMIPALTLHLLVLMCDCGWSNWHSVPSVHTHMYIRWRSAAHPAAVCLALQEKINLENGLVSSEVMVTQGANQANAHGRSLVMICRHVVNNHSTHSEGSSSLLTSSLIAQAYMNIVLTLLDQGDQAAPAIHVKLHDDGTDANQLKLASYTDDELSYHLVPEALSIAQA